MELRNILQSDEFNQPGEPRKLIVFTEHRDTLNYLEGKIRTLLGRPEAVVWIHGGVRREDRRRIQDAFPTTRRQDPGRHGCSGRGREPAAGEPNGQLRPAVEPEPDRAAIRRIHRIGQEQVCHLWNLAAHGTREGMVFQRLFARSSSNAVYGDQIYDVLGDSEINRSLQDC